MSHFGTTDEYLKICETFDQVGFQSRVYTTEDLAIYDVLQSVIHLMPHKNKMAVIHRGNYLMDTAIAVGLKNQQQINSKKNSENTIAFLESLEAATHTFVWSVSHHFTREIYYNETQILEILEVCHRKKIFSVCLMEEQSLKFQQKLNAKDQMQYALFIEINSIFNIKKSAFLFLSEKLKLSLIVSGLQESPHLNSLCEIDKSYPIVFKTVKTSALAVKQYLNLVNQQAFTLAELPFWVTDKWSSWWPEINGADYIRDTLFLSSSFVESYKNYLELIENAENEIQKKSSWVIA